MCTSCILTSDSWFICHLSRPRKAACRHYQNPVSGSEDETESEANQAAMPSLSHEKLGKEPFLPPPPPLDDEDDISVMLANRICWLEASVRALESESEGAVQIQALTQQLVDERQDAQASEEEAMCYIQERCSSVRHGVEEQTCSLAKC